MQHGSRFDCLVKPRHKGRVVPKATAEDDLQEAKKLFFSLEAISLVIPETLYLISIFIFIFIKKMMGQPLPESRFGILGSFVIVTVTTCLGPKEYLKNSNKQEPLLAFTDDNTFIKDFPPRYRRVLSLEVFLYFFLFFSIFFY